MPNGALAEWVVGHFTDRDRAASAVGDLLELAPERGSLWFWTSIAGIVLAFNWRRLLAFAIGYLCLASVHGLSFRLLAPAREILRGHNNLAHNWLPFQAVLITSSLAVVVFAAAYVAVYRGLRDELTRFFFALLAVCSIAIFLLRVPAIVLLMMLALVVFSTVYRPWRRASVAAALALAVGFCGFRLILYLWPWYLSLFPLSATFNSVSTDMLPLLIAIIQAAACDWAHWLLLDRPRTAAAEVPGLSTNPQ